MMWVKTPFEKTFKSRMTRHSLSDGVAPIHRLDLFPGRQWAQQRINFHVPGSEKQNARRPEADAHFIDGTLRDDGLSSDSFFQFLGGPESDLL